MEVYGYCFASVSLGVHYCAMTIWMYTNYCFTILWRVMYRVKNKFEVMYTPQQVNYEAENIMELLISHIMYVYWSYFSKGVVVVVIV
jgi:hypothetical protein